MHPHCIYQKPHCLSNKTVTHTNDEHHLHRHWYTIPTTNYDVNEPHEKYETTIWYLKLHIKNSIVELNQECFKRLAFAN